MHNYYCVWCLSRSPLCTSAPFLTPRAPPWTGFTACHHFADAFSLCLVCGNASRSQQKSNISGRAHQPACWKHSVFVWVPLMPATQLWPVRTWREEADNDRGAGGVLVFHPDSTQLRWDLGSLQARSKALSHFSLSHSGMVLVAC